jgi:hypothetical protein
MGHRQCSLCDKPHRARGWCTAHYQRWVKYGDPTKLAETKKPMAPLVDKDQFIKACTAGATLALLVKKFHISQTTASVYRKKWL